MFINESKIIKRKFGNVAGNPNTKEFVRLRNFKSGFFGEVLSIKFFLLNIKIMLSYQELKFTFRYEQLLRKIKILLEIKALKE